MMPCFLLPVQFMAVVAGEGNGDAGDAAMDDDDEAMDDDDEPDNVEEAALKQLESEGTVKVGVSVGCNAVSHGAVMAGCRGVQVYRGEVLCALGPRGVAGPV